jgi:hypothetical protein
MIEPIPNALFFDPLVCLSRAKVLARCRYVAATKPDPLELQYRQLDRQYDNVWTADFDRLVCPFLPICDPIVNGKIVKSDPTHLTPAFAKTITTPVDDYLKQSGIISR